MPTAAPAASIAARAARYSDPVYWRLDSLQAPVFESTGPTLAIAGPGSGKTRTIIAKAVKLIHENRGDPGTVALVTFTKASAAEMLQRLRKALPGVTLTPRNTFIGTFHALCYRLLKAHWARIGVNPKILSDYEASSLVSQIVRECEQPSLRLDEALEAIARFKSMPADYPFTAADREGLLYRIFEAYEARRSASGVFEKNDLVRECLRLIRTGAIKPLPVKHMLADEMQDADLVQIDWVLAHFTAGVVPTLVADDDQSIYGFRHAAGFGGLRQFTQATGAAILPMTFNYRSGTRIVKAASLIIEGSPHRFGKTIEAKRAEPGEVHLQGSYTHDAHQASGVVQRAMQWLQAHPDSSAAIISRTNAELDLAEQACRVLGQPFIRLSRSDFMARPHVASALLAVRCAVDPMDGIAFAASAGGCCPLSGEARHRIEGFFQERHGREHVLDAASEPALLAGMKRDDQTAFREFRGNMAEWFDAAHEAEPVMVGAMRMLLAQIGRQQQPARAADIESLATMLEHWCHGTLTCRLATLDHRPTEAAEKEGAITLCSAHASKGLEFEHVTVINAQADTWPHDKAADSVPEERRLFYVAATRAKDCLNFSVVNEKASASPFTWMLTPVISAGVFGEMAATSLAISQNTSAPGKEAVNV